MVNISRTIKKIKRPFSGRAKKVSRSRAGNITIIMFVSLFAIFSSLPLILMISQAFKPLNELFLFPPRLFVENPTLDNFKMLFNLMDSSWVPFTRYIFNTAFVSICGTLGHVIIASMAAYAISKTNLPGMSFFFTIVIFSLMYNAVVGDVANYITMSSLGWVDTYWSIIVPAFGSSLGVFLMKQFMSQIPLSLIESAKLDGAGEFRIYWGIVMPNVKPASLTLFIFVFKDLWNAPNTTYLYSEQFKMLPQAINQIVSGGIIRAGAGAAVGIIMLIVPLTFFILTQSQIIETMTLSGIKE